MSGSYACKYLHFQWGAYLALPLFLSVPRYYYTKQPKTQELSTQVNCCFFSTSFPKVLNPRPNYCSGVYWFLHESLGSVCKRSREWAHKLWWWLANLFSLTRYADQVSIPEHRRYQSSAGEHVRHVQYDIYCEWSS